MLALSRVDLQKLDAQITQYCDANRIFGVIRITLQDEIVFEKQIGYADPAKKIPFTEHSMFSFYSLSKPFCVMGLLKLKERGLLSLDVHPSVYVPEAVGFDARVTVRHLLHHVSGLPDFGTIPEFVQRYAPGYARYAREHLSLLSEYPQQFPPATASKYANVNMVLCALIIENLSGLSYAEYMKREVFEVLGMKTAVVDHESLEIPHRVQGHALSEDGELIAVERSPHWMLGAGDIVGTVDDAYALNRAIKHGLLLTKEMWQEVLTPHPLNKFGMGCTVSTWHEKKRITHNGGHVGFRTFHVQLPEDDFDFIILSNSGYGTAREDLAEIIHAAFYEDTDPAARNDTIEMDKGYV